jgi:hypothetical protein
MSPTIRSRVLRGLPALVLAPARLLERAKGRRRMALGCLYVLVVVCAGLLARRESWLAYLPDIGDPFDPAPLRALRVPDDRNAFTLYRAAAGASQHNHGVERRIFNAPYAWPQSDPEALAYLDANRVALELWRLGCEAPEALYCPVDQIKFGAAMRLYDREHRHFVRMALVVANRHRALGDMGGAWRWYRATLRGSRLIGRHAVAIGQRVGITEYAATIGPVASWAADPRVDADLLRRALEETKAINALTAPPSEAVKIESLLLMKALDDPEGLARFLLEEPWGLDAVDETIWYNHSPAYRFAERFMTHEPERSRRLLRLAVANILTHCDDPPDRRPALISGGTKNVSLHLFDTPSPPGAPAPENLLARLSAAPMVNALLPAFGALTRAFDRDRAQRASLVSTLTTELSRRARALQDGPQPSVTPSGR